jgi:hypothetical protein
MSAIVSRKSPPLPVQGARYIPITDLPSLRTAGILYPDTMDAWRYQARLAKVPGSRFEKAFINVGRRVLVDVAEFLAAIGDQPKPPRAPAKPTRCRPRKKPEVVKGFETRDSLELPEHAAARELLRARGLSDVEIAGLPPEVLGVLAAVTGR